MELVADNTWIMVPLIVAARVCDVTLGTVRTISLFRGQRVLASVLGFFEVLIWLAAAAQVFQNLDKWHLAFAYAGGFGLGNYVGCWVDGKIAVGYELVRIVSMDPDAHVGHVLEERGHDVIELQGRNGSSSKAEVVLAVESRRRVPAMLRVVREADPHAVWTITDVRRRTSETSPLNRRDARRSGWRHALRK